VVGDLRIHSFRSRIFQNDRCLRVWLPPRYDAPENRERHYPVFYLNDGQNLFDPATSYTGVKWAVDVAADRLIRQQEIAPTIFVGIDNAQAERIKEYLPYRSNEPRVWWPRGKSYPDFLLREVVPFVCQHYRVARGAENTGLGGSSMGAAIALYFAMARPKMIGSLLLESPSLFVSQRRLLRESRAIREWPQRIFLATGTRETENEETNARVVEDVRALESILRLAGLGEDRLRVRVDEGATHSEGAWAARFPEAIAFLLAPKPASS